MNITEYKSGLDYKHFVILGLERQSIGQEHWLLLHGIQVEFQAAIWSHGGSQPPRTPVTVGHSKITIYLKQIIQNILFFCPPPNKTRV